MASDRGDDNSSGPLRLLNQVSQALTNVWTGQRQQELPGYAALSAGQSIDGNSNFQVGRDIHAQTINFYGEGIALAVRLPSYLAHAVWILSQRITIEEPDPTAPLVYEIDDKIKHNNLRGYREIIEEYGNYEAMVDAAYSEIDAQQPGARIKIMRQFQARYLKIKADLLAAANPDTPPIQVIRESADSIMRLVCAQVQAEIMSSGRPGTAWQDVDPCVLILVCHAFINCKILEKP